MYKQVETKTFGNCIVQTFDTSDFNVLALNNVSQSTALDEQWNTRFGQQYMYLGARIKMTFLNQVNPTSSTTIKPIQVRVLILEGYKLEQTQPPTSLMDMWTNVASEQVNWADMANTPQTMFLTVDTKRYKTWYDKIHTVGIGRNSANGWGLDTYNFSFWPKKKINCQQLLNGGQAQDRMFYIVYFTYDRNVEGEIPDTPIKATLCWKSYWKDP